MGSEKIPTGNDDPAVAADGGEINRSDEPHPAPVPEGESGERSLVDLAQQPVVQSWSKFVGALFALIGVGTGLLVLLVVEVFEASLWEVSGFGGVALSLPPDQAPYLAVFVGALLGAYLGRTLSTDDTTTYLVAGISVAVGTVALLLTSALLTSVAVSDLSLRFGDLLVVSIVSALVVGIVGVAGVWIGRNVRPDEAVRPVR